MKIFLDIKNGLIEGFKYKWIAFYILLIQLVLSLFIGSLTYNYIQGSIGHSTNLQKIIDGYNHDVFQDLLRFESTGWRMIKTFMVLVVIVYLILGPFIMGGLLNAFKDKEDKWSTFWMGGSRYYFSFLKLNLIILGTFLFFAAFFGFISVWTFNYGTQHFLTELPTLGLWVFLLFLLILIVILLVSISTSAKWIIIEKESRIWTAIKYGFRLIRRNFFYYLGLGIFYLLISLGLAIFSNFMINWIPESGFMLVLLAFLLQIAFLYFRILLRNSYYSSILSNSE